MTIKWKLYWKTKKQDNEYHHLSISSYQPTSDYRATIFITKPTNYPQLPFSIHIDSPSFSHHTSLPAAAPFSIRLYIFHFHSHLIFVFNWEVDFSLTLKGLIPSVPSLLKLLVIPRSSSFILQTSAKLLGLDVCYQRLKKKKLKINALIYKTERFSQKWYKIQENFN